MPGSEGLFLVKGRGAEGRGGVARRFEHGSSIMPELGALVEEFETPEISRRPAGPVEAPYQPPKSRGEPPSVFVKFWILVSVLLVAVSGGLLCYAFLFSPIQPLPDFRWTESYQLSEPTVAVEAPPEDDRRVWVGTKRQGILRFEPRTLMWRSPVTQTSTGGRLLADHICGIPMSYGLVGICCESEGRRGLLLARPDGARQPLEFWARPFLDLSHLGIDSGDTLTSVTAGARPDEIVVGSAQSGIGIYHLPTRRWVEHITRASGGIGDDHVHDLYRWPGGVIVAHDLGIDLCRDEEGKWVRVATITGVGSKGVSRIYARRESAEEIDLWCVTVGRGLVALTLRRDGTVRGQTVLISERSVPGLTAESCVMADFHPLTDVLWVGFRQGEGIGFARYWFPHHDWAGTEGPVPSASIRCLRGLADGSALIGTADGVWQVWDAGLPSLQVDWRGLRGEDVTEIAASKALVWARSRWSPEEGMVPYRLRTAVADSPQRQEEWGWSDLLGPSRFDGLTEEDLTCAAPIPGSRDFYFGTKSKGIGRWRGASHEPECAFAPGVDDAPQGVLDITCPPGGQIVAIGSDHQVRFFDGRRWQRIFTPSGLPGRPEEVITAAARGAELFVATSEKVGRYDMASHQWRILPSLKDVVQLERAGDILWARTRNKELFALSLFIEDSYRWQKVRENVVHLDAYGDVLLAITEEESGVYHLFLSRGNSMELTPAVTPRPLSSPLGNWTASCAAGAHLYVGGMEEFLARYDLSTHQWETIPLPGSSTGAKQLEATSAGLWFVSHLEELWLWDAQRRIWLEPPICSHVESIAGDEKGIAVLMRPPSGSRETARLAWVADQDFRLTLIGGALDSPVETATAAAEFREGLFLGCFGGWHRYDRTFHEWKTFPLEQTSTVQMFASTGKFLYGLVGRESEGGGTLYRFDPEQDAVYPISDPQEPSQSLGADFITADGSRTVAFMRKDEGVVAIVDDAPDELRSLYPSSASQLARRQVTFAAENGESLCLGTDAGTVHIYGKAGGGERRWQVVQLGEGSSWSGSADRSVRRIFFPDPNTMVTVRSDNVLVHRRKGEGWQLVRQVFPQPTPCDAWDAGGGRILVVAFEEDAPLRSTLVSQAFLDTPSGGSSKQELLGSPLSASTRPLPPTTKVAEWVRPNDLWLFRVAADGTFWCYSLARRGWERQPFGQVEQLIPWGDTLWAYAPGPRELYFLMDGDSPRWQAFTTTQQIADFVSDDSMLLVRHASGQVEGVWPAGPGQLRRVTLIPEVPPGLERIQGSPSALAEVGHYLLCSFASEGTYAYDMQRHQWTQAFPREVKQFLRTKGSSPKLFALSGDGQLLRWEEGQRSLVKVGTPAPVDTATVVEELLAIGTADGGIYVSEDGHGWQAVIDPRNRLSGSAWPPITAIAEWEDKLWLGLGQGGKGQLACFDPRSLRWEQADIPAGVPERFFIAGDALWVVTVESKLGRHLYQVRSPVGLTQVAKSLRNVWVYGEELWVLTNTGELQRARTPQLSWQPVFPDFQPSLPLSDGIRVTSAVATGSDLAVVLSDSSVWHHSDDSIGWKRILPSVSGRGFQRQVLCINGLLITSEPDGSLLGFNPRKGAYEPIPLGTVLAPGDPAPPKWEVRSPGQGLTVQVRRTEDSSWVSLQTGILPWDDFVDLAVDAEHVYLQTRGGSIRVVRKADGQDVTAQFAGQSLEERFRRPSSLALDGRIFMASVEPQGLWEGPEKQTRISIVLRAEAGLPLKGVVRPYVRGGQLGTTWQWGYSLAGEGSTLLAAFPDGLFVWEKAGNSLVLRDAEVLFDVSGQTPVIYPGNPAIALTASGDCFVFDSGMRKWESVPGGRAEKLRELLRPQPGVAERSVLGPTWTLEEDGNKLSICLRTQDGHQYPVTLGRGGLGLDRVVAMALSPTEIIFFTPDGKVVYDKAETLGVPKTVFPAQAARPDMVDADCYTIPAPRGFQAACRRRGGSELWVLGEGGWEKLSDSPSPPAPPEGPLFQGQYCTWVDDGLIEIRPPAGGRGQGGRGSIRTSLDLQTGRFSVDEWIRMAAHRGEIWAFSRAGLVRITPAGFAEAFLQEDSSYDWAAGGTLEVISEEQQSWLVAGVRTRDSGDEQLLVWEQGRWRPVRSSERIYQLYRDRHERLLRGTFWRIDRSRINASPERELEHRWPWQPPDEFITVTIDPSHPRYPDVFDFERVNGLRFFGGELWLATDAGVIAVSPSTGEITYFGAVRPKTPVSRLAEREGILFAEAGGIYRWDPPARQWRPAFGEDPFEVSPVLLSTPNWHVVRQPQLEISCRWSADSTKLEPVRIIPDPAGGYRFEFDVVSVALPTGRDLVLLSAAGLVERSLEKPADVRRVVLPGVGPSASKLELFVFGPKEQQQIIARAGIKLFQRDPSGKWEELNPDKRSRVEPFLGKFLAWTQTWYVEKGSPSVKIRVRFPRDIRYKTTVFKEARGLFDFDILTDGCVYDAGDVLIATEGGIGRLDSQGRWLRRYADTLEDGIPHISVTGLAKREGSQLLAKGTSQFAAGESFYEFQREKDRWEAMAPGPQTTEMYQRLRSLLFENPQGWAAVDLQEYNRGTGRRSAPSSCSLSLVWKGEPVWLIGFQEKICFAHDVRYSVQWHKDYLWYATEGGVLREKPPGRSTASSSGTPETRLYAQDFGPKTDLWNPRPPVAVGLIKVPKSGGDPMVLLLSPPVASEVSRDFDFSRAFLYEPKKDGFVPAVGVDPSTIARCVDDGFWYWFKRSPDQLTVDFHPGRADITPDYVRLANGTFRFFDLIPTLPEGEPLRSVAFYGGRLFVATQGGLMSFDGEKGNPVKLYALAFPLTGGSPSPIRRVVGLFYSCRRQQLFAKCELLGGTSRVSQQWLLFESTSSRGDQDGRWVMYFKTDPLEDAEIVVDNDLLTWRQKPDRADIHIKNSDIDPGTPYQLFFEGKFSFDHVFSVATPGEFVWLATAGGAVAVLPENRRIERLFAQCFGLSEDRRLPDLREICSAPLNGSQRGSLYARTSQKQTYEYVSPRDGKGLGQWREVPSEIADPAFEAAYRKDTPAPEFWTWVQPPDGIYVQLHPTQPPNLQFGACAPHSHYSLMSRGRFAWDDLRDAVLMGRELIFATPGGICVYELGHFDESVTLKEIHGRCPQGNLGETPMTNVERIVVEGQELAAWNREHVFRGRRTSEGWQWEVDLTRQPSQMKSTRRLVTRNGEWHVIAGPNNQGLTVVHMPQGQRGRKITLVNSPSVSVANYDLSQAILADQKILIPGKKGVLCIDLEFAQRQKAWQRISIVVAVLSLIVAGIAFAPAGSISRRSSGNSPKSKNSP